MIPVERFYEPLQGHRLRLPGEGVLLRRVVGGIAWPHGPDPGAIVVLGEDMHPHPEYGVRVARVLAHEESRDLQALFSLAKRATDVCHVGLWVANLAHPLVHRIEDFDDGLRRRRQPPLNPDHAPLAGEAGRFPAYADMLRARVAGTKTLIFGRQFQDLAREVQAIAPEDEMRAQPEQYPGPCALFYALAEVEMRPPLERRAARRPRTGDPVAGY